MIKLGELNIGDTFYIINKEGSREEFGYISSVEKHTVGAITNLKIGKLIKWEEPGFEGFPHGVTIETKEYTRTTAPAYYNSIVCADKKMVEKMLKRDRKIFMENHNRMLSAI